MLPAGALPGTAPRRPSAGAGPDAGGGDPAPVPRAGQASGEPVPTVSSSSRRRLRSQPATAAAAARTSRMIQPQGGMPEESDAGGGVPWPREADGLGAGVDGSAVGLSEVGSGVGSAVDSVGVGDSLVGSGVGGAELGGGWAEELVGLGDAEVFVGVGVGVADSAAVSDALSVGSAAMRSTPTARVTPTRSAGSLGAARQDGRQRGRERDRRRREGRSLAGQGDAAAAAPGQEAADEGTARCRSEKPRSHPIHLVPSVRRSAAGTTSAQTWPLRHPSGPSRDLAESWRSAPPGSVIERFRPRGEPSRAAGWLAGRGTTRRGA